ncbi:MAG TPA: hypothetical protein VE132_08415 [Micromonosporaceae bacterium]|nr:hypothetical protein [Micromonosporaceae bacterium]
MVIVGSVLLILVAVGLLVGGVVDGSNPLIVGSMAATVVAAIVLVVGVRQSADEDDADAPAADNTPTQVFPSPFRETVEAGRRSRWDRFRRGGVPDGTVLGAEPTPPVSGESLSRGAIPTQAAGRRGPTDTHDRDVPPQGTSTHAGSESTTETGTDDAGLAAVGRDGMTSAAPFDASDSDSDEYDDEFDDEIPADEPEAESVSLDDAARVAALSREVLVIDGRPRYHLAHCVHLMGRESEPLPIAEAIELGFTPCALCEPDTNLLAEASQV